MGGRPNVRIGPLEQVSVEWRHGHPASTAGSLSRRERGGVRGYKLSRVRCPLTPTLSPLGRGSPAVPQIESVLITKACAEMNGTRLVLFLSSNPDRPGGRVARGQMQKTCGVEHATRHVRPRMPTGTRGQIRLIALPI